jgi:UDP-GlcNAc:undecaprenyl-phosphate/decaprenyl-phosphate GlcNAc-1-phosphate transferase
VRDQLLVYLPVVSLTFLAALALVAALTPRVEAFARRIGALQQGGGRRVHEGAVPNIGGVAIFGGFVAALMLGSFVRPELLAAYRLELLAILLGGALMTLVGFFDDLWEVPVATRLACQGIAAGILVANGVTIDFITNYFGSSPYQFFGAPLAALLTVVWVVGFTNAFNFIDGLDGLSSGLAAISSLALLAVAVQLPDRGAAVLLLAALAGAALGFLRHNYNPAKVIMGDSGAYLLGFVLAAASVLGSLKVTAAVTVAAPILILALPVVNLTQVTLRRLSRRANPARAANDHLHDLIRVRSGSKPLTVLVLWGAALVLGACGMTLSQTPPKLIYLTVLATVVLVGGVSFLRVREVERELRRA